MPTSDATKAPFAATALAPPEVEVAKRDDGTLLLRSPAPLPPHPDHLIAVLRAWADRAPERAFLAARLPGGGAWETLSYAAAARRSASIAQALLDRGHGPERPIAILSDNSIDFALLMLGAMHVSIPVMPVSPAYSLMSADHVKLGSVVAAHDPSLIFVDDPAPFAKALAAIDATGRALVTSRGTDGSESLAGWAASPDGPEVEARLEEVGPDTVAKILLTSGSTGVPKGVVNTQRMMCANQAMMAHAWPFLTARPPVIVDWLPWNHTFGGNFCFNMILFHGGTLYIDGGKPVPGRIEKTVENLRSVSPTLYLNVPRGYDMLLPVLEADTKLRDGLLADLDALFYAGAALPESLRQRLVALSVAARGDRIPITTSLGSTETAPGATHLTWDSDVCSNIGLPLPGTSLKLVPCGDTMEVRFKGPHITPGYYGDPAQSARAFDEEGYFGTGDAVRFIDPENPSLGLRFDGRVAENFKLSSGTWVAAGTLRLAAISAVAPVLQDAVITGHDRNDVGLLGFPNAAACRILCPDLPADAPLGDILARPEIRDRIAAGLAEHNRGHPGSSTRIVRALLLVEPPAIDAGEITDKGYVNQRAVLERRAVEVERLYADGPDTAIIAIPRRG